MCDVERHTTARHMRATALSSSTRAFSLALRARDGTRTRTRSSRAMTTTTSASSSFYDLSAQTLDGGTLNFGDLRGKVVIVTNVASR
jgi:hypothetical protein